MRYLLLICVFAFGAGCAMKDPVALWQKNLAGYIEEQGGGDPNVLRDTVDMHSRRALRPARITFGGEFAGPGLGVFREKRVINGVLLGRKEVGSRSWYLFLVGVMGRGGGELEDVRLAGFAPSGVGLLWRTAPEDSEAAKLYAETYRGSFRAMAFPSPLDEYSLEISGNRVIVKEMRSGAAWEMDLGE